MTDRNSLSRRAQERFEKFWHEGDSWNFEGSEFEQARLARQMRLLEGCRYPNALELGCGAGAFTRRLAPLCDHLVAIDIAPSAIARARANSAGCPGVDLRVANIMDFKPRAEGPWDLVVLSETIYCLGWLYPMFDVGWLASEMFAAIRTGGRLLMGNTFGKERDYLLLPWLVRTYRDLFLNIGYRLEREEIFRGTKDTVEFEVLISLFEKPEPERHDDPQTRDPR